MTDLIEDVGTITATWTDPAGTVWELSNNSPDLGWFTPPGPAGWGATTYEIVTDPLPRGGEEVRFVRSKPGHIVWPVYVWGETHLQFIERYRQIKRAFMMTLHRRTAGTLTVARPDGTSRSIDAYYESGWEGESGENWLYATAAVALFTPDGYWRDDAELSHTNSYVAGNDYFNPFPQVSAGLALGETVLTNPGDVDAWPTWTITGPLTAIAATNVTTGYEFTLTYGLLAGEQITITTVQPSVRGPYGQNLAGSLDWPAAYLWWLAPGDNDVIFNVSGGSAGTSVQLAYHPRYEGA